MSSKCPPSLDAAFGEHIGAINERLAGFNPHDRDDLIDSLAHVYSGLLAADRRALRSFETLDEAWLVKAALDRAERVLAAGTMQITVAPEDAELSLRDSAVLLRALEQLIGPSARIVESDVPGELEQSCLTGDLRHYVVPQIVPHRARTGQSLRRRALLYYRVIPAQINPFRVRLYRLPALHEASVAMPGDSIERRYAAAFFPGLKAVVIKADTRFHLENVEGFAPHEFIAPQLEASRAAGCVAIIWPELTMPDAHLAILRECLSASALDDEGQAPHFLVAGSWHRQGENGERCNIAPILDNAGLRLFDLVKWSQFRHDGRLEDIVPGDEIPLLVTEDGLIVFAICRDFLDDNAEPPYCLLDVDLALVPSMASLTEPATMEGHSSTARTMAMRFGTKTMVVLQPPFPAHTDEVGQTFTAPTETGLEGVVHTVKSFWADYSWKQ